MWSHEERHEVGRLRVTVTRGDTTSSSRVANARESHAEATAQLRNERGADLTRTAGEGSPRCPVDAWCDDTHVTPSIDVTSPVDDEVRT